MATLSRDADGRSESWQMLEAAGFSSATSYLLKYAAGRERPDVTNDPNQWRTGGNSFPRCTPRRRLPSVPCWRNRQRPVPLAASLPGIRHGGYTGYARLKHNAHWLSDTVAGAGIGMSTAHFVMDRHEGYARGGQLTWIPLDGGVMVSYNVILP